MPLKLNVGISKKIGLPDYGSLGTICNVEVEVDSGLIFDDLEAFHQKVRQVYVACAQAVNDELARQAARTQPTSQAQTAACHDRAATNGNGHRKGTNCVAASQKQLNYANQLAGQIDGLDDRRLETLASKMFGKPLVGLSTLEASALIDALKAIREGRLDLHVLDGATV